MNSKKSSNKLWTLASKTLTSKSSSQTAKKLAWSILSQVKTNNQTWKKNETLASKVLKSSKYSKITKKLAASALSQSNKKR